MTTEQKHPNDSTSYFDGRYLFDRLVIEASSDGDAYRDGMNAEQAIDKAILALKASVLDDLNNFRKEQRAALVAAVRDSWSD